MQLCDAVQYDEENNKQNSLNLKRNDVQSKFLLFIKQELILLELFEGYDYDLTSQSTNKFANSTNNNTSPLMTVISTKGQTTT